jgi:hypothetical protein
VLVTSERLGASGTITAIATTQTPITRHGWATTSFPSLSNRALSYRARKQWDIDVPLWRSIDPGQ